MATPAPAATTTKETPQQPGTHSFVVSGTRFDVSEHYKLIKPIGHGAYGVVVSANDEKNNDKVAIKKVPRAFDDLIDAKRILREIKLLRHFDHENVRSFVLLYFCVFSPSLSVPLNISLILNQNFTIPQHPTHPPRFFLPLPLLI